MLTEHQAGRVLDMPPAGIRVRGRKSTPGRYFQVANPGLGWGGTDITDPLAIIQKIDPTIAWPGLRLLLTSTTGEDALYCVLDEKLRPVPAEMPAAVRAVVERIGENCEPSLCTVLFMAGAGGSLRAGVTDNPVLLTRSVAARRDARHHGRRAGLRLAGRRHHRDGGRDAHAEGLVRLRADAGDRRADRVHAAARALRAARRARRRHRARPREMLAARRGRARASIAWPADNPWPFDGREEASKAHERASPSPLRRAEPAGSRRPTPQPARAPAAISSRTRSASCCAARISGRPGSSTR